MGKDEEQPTLRFKVLCAPLGVTLELDVEKFIRENPGVEIESQSLYVDRSGQSKDCHPGFANFYLSVFYRVYGQSGRKSGR